jgi:hypothetical protein
MHTPKNFDKQNRSTVKLKLSDETLIDGSEYLNGVYEDFSQITEILSFQDPCLTIEGTALFYSGFEVLSSLEPVFLQALGRLGLFHGIFEKSSLA